MFFDHGEGCARKMGQCRGTGKTKEILLCTIWPLIDDQKLFAGVAQLVERQPSKLNVEGSSPFARFQRHRLCT